MALQVAVFCAATLLSAPPPRLGSSAVTPVLPGRGSRPRLLPVRPTAPQGEDDEEEDDEEEDDEDDDDDE